MVSARRVGALAAVSVVLSASSASAQEPGVTLDPGSPAAKEYALPIEQARRDADGDKDPGSSSTSKSKPNATSTPNQAAPVAPFGEGIRPTAPKSNAAPGRKQARSKAKAEPDATVTPRERAKAQDSITRALTAASVNNGDSSDGSLVLLLGGSIVMVLGVALGYLLRRRRQA